MKTFGRSHVLAATLLFFVSVVPAYADAIYTLTIPSSITVASGTTGAIPATFTNLGPDPVFLTGGGSVFIPGLPCCIDFQFDSSFWAIFGTPLAPGVYNYTYSLTVPATFQPGFVTDISSYLQISLVPFTGGQVPGALSPFITTSFSVGAPPSLGSNVTVSGKVSTVPEPSSILLLGTGLLGLATATTKKLLRSVFSIIRA